MQISRPKLRIWPSILAIVLAYPAAGFLYGLFRIVHIYATSRFSLELLALSVFLDPLLLVQMSISTITSLGFPLVYDDSDERINLYPLIVPAALLFLAFATRSIRLGKPNAAVIALIVILAPLLAFEFLIGLALFLTPFMSSLGKAG